MFINKDISNYIKAKLAEFKQRVSNVAGNIQAIANPQTRADYFRGFTPQQVQPIEDVYNRVKTNAQLMANPTYQAGFQSVIPTKAVSTAGRISNLLTNKPYFQQTLARLQPKNKIGGFLYKQLVYNPEEKKFLPLSPLHDVGAMVEAAKLHQQGKISRSEMFRRFGPAALGFVAAVSGGLEGGEEKALAKGAGKIPKELEPLAKEARKYKSAEEFVNSRRSFQEFDYWRKRYDNAEKLAKRVGNNVISKDGVIVSRHSTPELAKKGLKKYVKEIKNQSEKELRKVAYELPDLYPEDMLKIKSLKDFYNQAIKGVKELKVKPQPKIKDIKHILERGNLSIKEKIGLMNRLGLNLSLSLPGEVQDKAEKAIGTDLFHNIFEVGDGLTEKYLMKKLGYDLRRASWGLDSVSGGSLDEIEKEINDTIIKLLVAEKKLIEKHILPTKSEKFINIDNLHSYLIKEVKPQPKIKLGGIKPEKPVELVPQFGGKTLIEKTAKAPKGVEPSKAKSITDSIPPKDKVAFKHIVDENMADVKKKVNILDYLATPKYVLDKIGLGKEAEQLDRAYDNYKIQVPKEIEKISKWREQVPGKESSQKIFRYLDGQKVKLDKKELAVAKDIKNYLSRWADKLNLPEDKRITHYITHIFERDFIKKEFDPELAKIIADKPAGSVYDPFLQKRLGKKGYVENVWRALSAYVKRATRKYNLDPALAELKKSAQKQPLENYKYIMRLTHGINMRPTEIDNLVDNLVKQSPVGYKFGQRPTTVLTRALRQQIYRGGLGFNIGSALKNLTQGINTYAELGEKYTAKGYFDLLTKGAKELYENGVLDTGLIEDKSLPVYKSLLNKLDEALYYLFEKAELINRGAAYYGAKARALDKGMSEKAAIDYAKNIVAKTQFKFGGVHTPVAMQSDLAKTLLQFQTYSLKQVEFLAKLAKNKEWQKLARYIISTLAVYGTLGKALGWGIKDISIPSLRFSSPTTSILGAGYKYITTTDKNKRNEAKRDLLKSGTLLVPAGGQLKKTIEGVGAYNRGYSRTPSGRLRYPVKQNLSNKIKTSLFGQYAVPEARQYFNKKRKPLGLKQTEKFKLLGRDYYNQLMAKREGKSITLPQSSTDPMKYAIAYGYNKYFTPPVPAEGKLKLIKFNHNKLNAAVRLLDDNRIPDQAKQQIIQTMGYKPADITYESLARLKTGEKVQYLIDGLEGRDKKSILTFLLQGRQKSLTGRQFVTNTVLKGLYEKGLISYGEYKGLVKRKRSTRGGRRKVKKLRVRKLYSPSLSIVRGAPQIPVVRSKTRLKLKKVSLKIPKTRLKVKKINLKIPKLA